MEYIVKQASIENIEEITKIFNEYRIFYKQDSNISGAKDFLLDRFEHFESIIFIAIEEKSNKTAQNLYEKNGYKKNEEYYQYYMNI